MKAPVGSRAPTQPIFTCKIIVGIWKVHTLNFEGCSGILENTKDVNQKTEKVPPNKTTKPKNNPSNSKIKLKNPSK